MSLKTTKPVLEFSEHVEELMSGLSAVLLVGKDVWVACDELTSVERLTLRGDDRFAGHRSFELHGPLNLPAFGQQKVDQEIDIEGLDHEGDYLWLVGSHSIKRKNVSVEKDRNDADEKNIDKLRKTESEGNRFLLARVPIVRDGQTGESALAATSADGGLTAAQLPSMVTENSLTRAILNADEGGKPDLHLSPWLGLPGKDNGFDVEGITVSGERVFLGLRGPVLRGWAVVLELHVDDGEAMELRLKKIGPKGRSYRKHFLNLGGLGVRDLCLDGEDILILAGPTMTHDGLARVFRWRGGAGESKETVVWPDEFAGGRADDPTRAGHRPRGRDGSDGGRQPPIHHSRLRRALRREEGGRAGRARRHLRITMNGSGSRPPGRGWRAATSCGATG